MVEVDGRQRRIWSLREKFHSYQMRALADGGKPVLVRLNDGSRAAAEFLGDGNVSLGIRLALVAVRESEYWRDRQEFKKLCSSSQQEVSGNAKSG